MTLMDNSPFGAPQFRSETGNLGCLNAEPSYENHSTIVSWRSLRVAGLCGLRAGIADIRRSSSERETGKGDARE